MSAWTRTIIDCDYHDTTAPAGQHFCFIRYEPPAEYAGKRTADALRRLAAKDGWTHARSEIARWDDKDYCPDHKPAGES